MTLPNLMGLLAPELSDTEVRRGEVISVSYQLVSLDIHAPGKGVAAPPSTTGIYLSTDSTITTSDILIGIDSVPSIPDGYSISGLSAFVQIPFNLVPGNYYVGVIADFQNLITEQYEADNASKSTLISIVPQPDLDIIFTPVVGATSIFAGDNGTISYEVDNIGDAAASASITGIYLSTDSVIDASDMLLATDLAGAINAGSWSTEIASFTLPSTLAPGTYYIGTIADYNNAITELRETNNPSVGVAISVKALFTDAADSISLPSGGQTWHALGGDDVVLGTSVTDTIFGDAGDDSIDGGAGDDTLVGGAGDDTILGGDGTDTVVFSGARSDYSITAILGGGYTISDLRMGTPDGSDTVTDLERFQFLNGTVTEAQLPFHSPTSITIANAVIAENSAAGTVVDVLTAIDPDLGDTHTFTVVGGDISVFEIVGANVQLKAGASLNFEGRTSYQLLVKATDSHGLELTQAVKISVTDVNEAPAVRLTGETPSIAENTSAMSRIKVSDIVVTDDALGTNGLSLTGTDAGSFEIDGTALYLKAGTVLDFEQKASYSVAI